MVNITFKLNQNMYDKLQIMCYHEKSTKSNIIRNALIHYWWKKEKEYLDLEKK